MFVLQRLILQIGAFKPLSVFDVSGSPTNSQNAFFFANSICYNLVLPSFICCILHSAKCYLLQFLFCTNNCVCPDIILFWGFSQPGSFGLGPYHICFCETSGSWGDVLDQLLSTAPKHLRTGHSAIESKNKKLYKN